MAEQQHPNLSAELKNDTKGVKGVGPAADIKEIKAKAKEIVMDDSIGSRDRMVHMKDAAR